MPVDNGGWLDTSIVVSHTVSTSGQVDTVSILVSHSDVKAQENIVLAYASTPIAESSAVPELTLAFMNRHQRTLVHLDNPRHPSG
jgi:hypothetical protein